MKYTCDLYSGKKAIETVFEGAQMLILSDKDWKAIISMFKELKENSSL